MENDLEDRTVEVTAIEQNTEKRIFKNEDSLRDLRNNIAEVVIQSPSRVRLTATPWTAAHQAPLSVGFSRQEFWSGLPFPSPETILSTPIFTL